MARFVSLTLAVVMAIGITATGPQTNGTSSSNAQSTTDVVKAVSDSSLTLERRGREILFGVDSSTRVFARGMPGYRPYPERRPTLTDFVKRGDQVSAKYRQSGSFVNAVEVRVARK